MAIYATSLIINFSVASECNALKCAAAREKSKAPSDGRKGLSIGK
jgi:hypothetical protein